MATAVSLRTVFTSSTSGLVSGANTAGNAMKKVQKDMAGMRGSLATLKTIAIGQVFAQLSGAAISAGRSLIGFGQSTAEGIDVLSKLSRRLGLTYGQMAGLKLAGDLAGVGVETIATAATKADVAFISASNGSQEAIDKFTSLGLSMVDLQKMSPEQRFSAIADAIAKLPTAAERSAAAIKLFGNSGAELVPLFEEGAGALQKAREQAEAFGLALSGAQGKEVEKMNDAFTLAYAAIQGIVTQVVANLAPAVSAIVEEFTAFVAGAGGVSIGEGIATALIDSAIFVVEMFGIAANFIYANVVEPMGGAAGMLSAAFAVGATVANVFMGLGNIISAAFSFAAAQIEMTVGMLLSAIGAIAAWIPGMGDTADQFKAAGSSMLDSANQSLADSANSAIAAGQNFSDAVTGGATASGEAVGNTVADAIAEKLKAAKQAAADAKNTPEDVAAQIDPAAGRIKAEAELRAKQKTAAEKIGNDTAKDNPLKTFRDSLSTLQDALFNEAISQEDFNKRFANIQDDLVAANQDALDAQAAQDGVSRQAVSGVDATSTAGVSEFFRLMRGAEPPGIKEQREAAANSRRLVELAEAAAGGLPVPVQLMPKGA